MAKFDYTGSIARKNYHLKKEFDEGVFLGISFVCGLMIMFGLFLVWQPAFVFGNLELAFGLNVLSGLGQILIGFSLLVGSYCLAKKYALPKISKENIVDRFTPELIDLFDKTIEEAKKEGHREITPEYLFSKISLTHEGKIIFLRLGLPFVKESTEKNKFDNPIFSAELVHVADEIFNETKDQIDLVKFLGRIVEESNLIQGFLNEFHLEKEDTARVIRWLLALKNISKKPHFWEDTPVLAGVGEDWAYGYTPTLSQYSYDLTSRFQNAHLEINLFSRSNKVDEMQNVLSKASKNNCLLVGEPGVGKGTVVEALASKMAKGDCLPPLRYKKIRHLDTGTLLAGANTAELAWRLNKCLIEAIHAGNIILYIENFQTLVGGRQAEVGGIDASQILLPYLQKSDLQIIASITPEDYFERLRVNAAMAGAFEKIEISPASIDDTISIALENVSYLEYRYNVFIPYQTIKTAVKLAERYLKDVPFPEKALRLLEEASTNFSGGQIKFISPKDVEDLVSKKANVPVGQVAETEKEKLLNLEDFLHKRVIGQNEAIKAVSDTLRRVRAGLTSGKRPSGVFLFLGPTGVGKTETAKALAENYFGSERRMIRLDMSEYQQPNSVDRLIGNTNNPNGILTNAIIENPFSLILLDEIEKADKNVLNLFLQVFEDGRLTDARGRTSDFTNSIIIATSNAGSELIRQRVVWGQTENLKKDLLESLQEKGLFTPEFLNRFDNTIVFKPLTQEETSQVANLMIKEVNKNLKDKKISIEIAADALQKLVQMGYDPQFGARPMRRVIQEKVENLLAKKMLSGELQQNQTLTINLADIE